MKSIYQKIKKILKHPPDKPEVKFSDIDKQIERIKQFKIIEPKHEPGRI